MDGACPAQKQARTVWSSEAQKFCWWWWDALSEVERQQRREKGPLVEQVKGVAQPPVFNTVI